MSSRRLRCALGAFVVLVAAAGAVLAAAPGTDTRHHAEFQQLVGGLGLGVALDLAGCTRAFDPRLSPSCGPRHAPARGGSGYCPARGFR